MTTNSNCFALADQKRFRPIQDLHKWSPDYMVAVDDSFELKDEFLFITDPIHLGQTMSASTDPSASYVQTCGLTVTHYGGKASCPGVVVQSVPLASTVTVLGRKVLVACQHRNAG